MYNFIFKSALIISIIVSVCYNVAKAEPCDLAWKHYKEMDQIVRTSETVTIDMRVDLIIAAYDAATCEEE